MYPIKTKEFEELLEGRAYISTSGKVYRIEALTEVENIQTDTRRHFEKSLTEMDNAFKRTYTELETKYNSAKKEGHKEGLKAGMLLSKKLPKDWKIVDAFEHEYKVEYAPEIFANNIKRGEHTAKIPNSLMRKFFVRNLIVSVDYNNKIIGGIGKGYSPHLEMSNVETDINGIPIPNENGEIEYRACLGDMNGQDFNEANLNKIVKEFKTINLDSAYGGAVTRQAEKIIEKAIADNRAEKQVLWHA